MFLKSQWLGSKTILKKNGKKNRTSWDSPGGPVVQTLCFDCRGTSVIRGPGTKIPHAAWHSQKPNE